MCINQREDFKCVRSERLCVHCASYEEKEIIPTSYKNETREVYNTGTQMNKEPVVIENKNKRR